MKCGSSVLHERFQSTYDKWPSVTVSCSQHEIAVGWDKIASCLFDALRPRDRSVLCVDCYVGVQDQQLSDQLSARLNPVLLINTASYFKKPDELAAMVQPFLGGDDPVFGFLSGLTLDDFFDAEKLAQVRQSIDDARGLVLVVGPGATAVLPGEFSRFPEIEEGAGVVVYADLPRREAHLRQRRNEVSNLGTENRELKASLQYKRSYFIDWRVCDRWKKPLLKRAAFLLDTTVEEPKLVTGAAFRAALGHVATRPFRVVPFFDPGPWGGQWMKQVCDLEDSAPNYAWCFDCVPEENSLLLNFDGVRFEIPALNLVFDQPLALLGEAVQARFGDEFPIRFDFLDTMDGGHLSFQVHPLTEYIQNAFGMHYTQDESYYLLDTGDDSCVYLGLRENIEPDEMLRDLRAAEETGVSFDAAKYANRWPAKKHDHFLIPAGTVHCSGRNSMVLEISATPYIFTFKLWDWGRLGLDGQPRPIHIDHGARNIQWDRTTRWVEANLIHQTRVVAEGPGWREERTGLDEREFIETRRHRFTEPVLHHTQGGVNVLNLVDGPAAVVDSPQDAFEPFVVHYAETFIVPAHVGRYRIHPSPGEECVTIKAYVRADREVDR